MHLRTGKCQPGQLKLTSSGDLKTYKRIAHVALSTKLDKNADIPLIELMFAVQGVLEKCQREGISSVVFTSLLHPVFYNLNLIALNSIVQIL